MSSSERVTTILLGLSLIMGSVLIGPYPARGAVSDRNEANRVAGHVLDINTNAPLRDSSVRLIEADMSVMTDNDGRFAFESVPSGTYTLVISHKGYVEQRIPITVPSVEELRVQVRPWPHIHESVTVTATPWEADRLEVAQSTDAKTAAVIHTRSGASVGEAVGDVPGVRNISTGDAGGVPMIRGQTNERIRVLSNGFPHDYYQFSRRHMPNIEPYESQAIEVIRGPASVLYGTQAMGGLVNLISAPLPTTEGGSPIFRGEGLLGYAGNNTSKAGHVLIEGASGGFGGRTSWTRRAAGDVCTPGGDLPNTDYQQQAYLLDAGYRFERGLQFRGQYKYWGNDLGLYLPPNPDFRLDLRNDIGVLEATVPSTWGDWRISANLARNLRRAYPLGPSQGAKVDLELDTQTYRASLQHREAGPLRGWLQLEHTRQKNQSFGPVTLLPNYKNRTWALAFFEQVRLARHDDLDRLVLDLGLRYDNRELDVPANPARGIPAEVTKTYSPVTGSISLVYRLNPVMSAGISFGQGWRNPSEFELFAEGPHDGALLYETGNPALVEETSLNTEVTFRLSSDFLHGYVAAYNNRFDNYIYQRLTGEVKDGLPVSTFQQGNADFKGVEGSLTVDIIPALQAMAAADHLWTKNHETGTRLPSTPPTRVMVGTRLHGGGTGGWSNPYLELRGTWTGVGKIAGPDEPFPLNTDSYTLLDLGAGIQRQIGHGIILVDLWVSNLTNKAYKDFLDTYKLYALSAGRNIRFTAQVLF